MPCSRVIHCGCPALPSDIATTLLPKKQLYQSVKYRIVDEAEEESRLEGIAPYGTNGEKEKLEPAPLGGGKASPYYGSV